MLKLVPRDDPVLHTEAIDVKDATLPNLLTFAWQMLDVVRERKGYAIAGPQVGLGERVIVMADGHMLANPTLSFHRNWEADVEECLSLPRERYIVERATTVHLNAVEIGSARPVSIHASGIIARVLQHEWDHLNGVMISDIGEPIPRSA